MARSRWLLSVSLAGLGLTLGLSPALAVPVTQSTPTPVLGAAAGAIASLVNQYLQAAVGASNAGDWLDATPSGTASNRGQSLLIPSAAFSGSGPGPGTATLNGMNSNLTLSISANDGLGDSISNAEAYVSQFNATYNANAGGSVSFNTFCIDLFHSVSVGQTYAVDARADLATAFTNGAEMAYILQNFGVANLASDPDQAAAVQIALWDLSLDNHDPTTFGQDADGTYSSGDQSIFSISFAAVPEPASLALLAGGLAGFGGLRRRGLC